MDPVDARLTELGQVIDRARKLLADPLVRQGMAEPARPQH